MKQRTTIEEHTSINVGTVYANLEALRQRRELGERAKRREVYELGRLLSEGIITHEELGVCKRTGDNYKAFYRAMSENKAEHLVEYVDPSKISLFYELLNPRNIKTVVRFCEERSVDELEKIAADFPLLVCLNQEKKTNKGEAQ